MNEYLQDSPDRAVKTTDNRASGQQSLGLSGTSKVPGDHSDEPMIKIQNQHSDPDMKLNTSGGQGGIPSSDIRQIKLNYIQLNKRATTASNNHVGRKIP